MLIKIKREDCFKKYPKFPKANYRKEEFFFPKIVESYTLTVKARSIKGHIKLLSNEITNLVNKLKFDSLVFMGDEKIPWLYQKNDYKPVKVASDYLKRNKIGKTFDGAIEVSLEKLPEFLEHLCWLSRCNASLPYFHFMNKGQNLIGEVCKYGNLHVYPLNTSTNRSLKRLVGKSEFINVGDQQCYEQYSKSGAIKGRITIV